MHHPRLLSLLRILADATAHAVAPVVLDFEGNEQLAVLVVVVGFLDAVGHAAEPAGLGENHIHLFEGAEFGLGVEEVDDWEDEGVAEDHVSRVLSKNGVRSSRDDLHDCEDDVGLVADVRKGGW